MSTRKLFVRTPITIAMLVLIQSAHAQSQPVAASDAEPNLASIVVTAQKREEKLQDVPVAITVLGGDNLTKSEGLKTANDITQLIPNASASATDGRTRPRWFLRGIGTNETAASTVSPIGIYNDDVYLNNVYIQGFPLFDIDRVEVLRGPQGTLWGKNTTGGAIHYQSRQPTFAPEAYAKVGFGSFNERSLQGVVSGPVVAERLAARISFYDEKRDGWVNNTATNQKAGAASDTAFRAQLLWLANDDTEVLAAVKSRKLVGDKSPSFYVGDPKQTIRNPIYAGPLNGREEIAQAGVFEEKLDADGASVRVNWSRDGYTLSSVTAYDTGNRVLSTGSPIALDISRSRNASDSKQVTQELRLASPKDKRYDWVVGAYYFTESLTSSSVARRDRVAGASSSNPASPSPQSFDITNFSQDTRSTALFASGTLRFNDAWSLAGGVRKSNESKNFDVSFSAAPTSAAFTGLAQWWLPGGVSALNAAKLSSDTNSWDEVTYDITPQWKINANANAYIRYAHGFRAGGFVVSPGNGITRLEPETLNSTELGLKTQWLDGKLTFNSALFNYDYRDIIVGVLLPVPGTTTTQQVQENAAKGTVNGAEFELAWQPSSKWRLAANLGLLKTKYSEYESSASGQTLNATGNRFTRAPEISLGLDAEYRIALTNGGSVSLGGDVSWRDKQYFNAVDQTTPTLEQSAYTLANARVTYRTASGKVEVSGFVRNLTDTVYSQLATNTATGVTREVFGLPRSYGVTALVRF